MQRESKNENNFDHVYVLQDLEEGSARRLKELDEIIKGKLSSVPLDTLGVAAMPTSRRYYYDTECMSINLKLSPGAEIGMSSFACLGFEAHPPLLSHYLAIKYRFESPRTLHLLITNQSQVLYAHEHQEPPTLQVGSSRKPSGVRQMAAAQRTSNLASGRRTTKSCAPRVAHIGAWIS